MDRNVFQSLADRVKTLLAFQVLISRLNSQPKNEIIKRFNLLDEEHPSRLDVQRECLLLIFTLFVMKELTLDHQEDGFTASEMGKAWREMIDAFPALKEMFVYYGDEPSLEDLVTRARYLIQHVFINSSEHDHDALMFDKDLNIVHGNFSVLERMNIYNEKQTEGHYQLSDSAFDFVLLTAEIFGDGLISIDTLRMNLLIDKKEFDKLLEQLNQSRANLGRQVNRYVNAVHRLDPNDQSSKELAMRFKERAKDWTNNLNYAKRLVESVNNSVDNSLENMQRRRTLISHDPDNKEFQKLEKNIRLIQDIKLGLRGLSNEMNADRLKIIKANNKLVSLINQVPSFVSIGSFVKKLDQGPLRTQEKASDYLDRFDLLLPLFEEIEPRFSAQSLVTPVKNPDFIHHLKLTETPAFNSAEDIKRQEAEAKRQEDLQNQHQAETIRKMFTSDQNQFTFKEQLQHFSDSDRDFLEQDPNQFLAELFPVASRREITLTKDKPNTRGIQVLQKLYADRLPVRLSMENVGEFSVRIGQKVHMWPNIKVEVKEIDG